MFFRRILTGTTSIKKLVSIQVEDMFEAANPQPSNNAETFINKGKAGSSASQIITSTTNPEIHPLTTTNNNFVNYENGNPVIDREPTCTFLFLFFKLIDCFLAIEVEQACMDLHLNMASDGLVSVDNAELTNKEDKKITPESSQTSAKNINPFLSKYTVIKKKPVSVVVEAKVSCF